MTVTAKDVSKLRQMTGAGLMDCKRSLTEAEGDFDKAVELLRKKGQKVFASRAGRATSEGVVFAKTNDSNSEGTLIAFTCETDFVAKNKEFMSLGNEIAELAFAEKPESIEALHEMSLGDLTVQEKIVEMTGKIGERLEVKDIQVLSGDAVVSYIHSNAKLGVLVALKNTNGSNVEEAGRDVAMQIAAMNPVAVDKESVDPIIVEKEIEIGREQARQEGKPENIIEKIAIGKL
ncbi:MAG: translation elongation factor Ts, partial [Ekhidna sp.]|nr:translation elongation factor Ts [Ekhidna sp.]